MTPSVSVGHPNYTHMTKFDEYLYVTSVGAINHCRYITKTTRPHGRDDYHILFVTTGDLSLKINTTTHILHPGDIAFIDYGVPHEYVVLPQDPFFYYWIHFKGNLAKDLLNDLGIAASFVAHLGDTPENRDLFDRLLNEIGTKRINYFKRAQQILTSILLQISTRASDQGEIVPFSQIDRVASMMRNENCQSLTVEDFAAMCSLSKSRFIKKFHQATGMSPIEYRNKAIVDKAIWHLKNTSLTVTEISNILGFINPSYFSTLFKKHTGYTPSEYRLL